MSSERRIEAACWSAVLRAVGLLEVTAKIGDAPPL